MTSRSQWSNLSILSRITHCILYICEIYIYHCHILDLLYFVSQDFPSWNSVLYHVSMAMLHGSQAQGICRWCLAALYIYIFHIRFIAIVDILVGICFEQVKSKSCIFINQYLSPPLLQASLCQSTTNAQFRSYLQNKCVWLECRILLSKYLVHYLGW